jgi:hypothetical protein
MGEPIGVNKFQLLRCGLDRVKLYRPKLFGMPASGMKNGRIASGAR